VKINLYINAFLGKIKLMETNNETRVWSEQQLPIFAEFKNGRRNFIVEARAGTGKTTTIQHGISLAPEAKKVYLAFNKKNVLEAQGKITDKSCQVMSLNGLGHRFVLRNWGSVKPDDSVETDRIIAAIKLVAPKSKVPLPVVRQIISFVKNTAPFISSTAEVVQLANARCLIPANAEEDDAVIAQIVLKCLDLAKVKDRLGRISFEDQLWLPLVMKWAHPWYDLVVVDECQDMNFTQLTLSRKACKARGRMVLVGDARQCIYGFRGADTEGMARMKIELNAVSYPLTVTYRCPQKIVDIAKKLVPDYVAHSSAPEGVVGELAGTVLPVTAKPGDAILSRTNAPLMTYCLALIRKGVPAYIEGRDIAATLKGIHTKVASGPKKTPEEYVKALDLWAADRIGRLVGDADSDAFKSSLQNIEDQMLTLAALADEVSDVSEIEGKLNSIFDDSEKTGRKAVVLSSIHKSKGMEWGNVFILSKTLKGVSWSPEVNANNNVAYVAVTRAKNTLTWVND